MNNANIALQDRFLKRFFVEPLANHFYLTGGTALARFYFHHRESLDLDLFTNDQDQDFAFVNQLLLGILHTLRLQITNQVITDSYIQYIVLDSNGSQLKFDLVKDVPVHFGSIVVKEGLRIDSMENIGSNKILAVFGRTDAKDFIDLYWILKHTKLEFDDLYQKAREKDLGLSLLYLSYSLQNIDKIRIFPRMLEPLPWDDIVKYFQTLSQMLLTRIKPE